MTQPELSEGRDEQGQPKWHERTRYRALMFAVGVVLFVVVVGLILDWYIDPQKATQRKDLAQALGLITAGVAGAVGIFFTWHGQRIARIAQDRNQKNTLEQLKQARDELDITRRGQITERFTQAIDQLGKTNDDGAKNMEVRLGGIYSLERTAREDRDYHWPIMEVLTSYVRQHAAPDPDEAQEEEDFPPPEPDIQAILTVIGRRSSYHRDVEYGSIDLRGVILRRTDLRSARLPQASLLGADLRQAYLQEAHLEGAGLEGADLRRAHLNGAHLQQAILHVTNFQGTDLQKADLRRAELPRAQLQAADLRQADLNGADLWEANLQGASLREATLQVSILQKADLESADLNGANLNGADLREADLREANLRKATLKGTMLQKVILEGADLRRADFTDSEGLTQEQLGEARGDKYTRLPPHLEAPDSWN